MVRHLSLLEAARIYASHAVLRDWKPGIHKYLKLKKGPKFKSLSEKSQRPRTSKKKKENWKPKSLPKSQKSLVNTSIFQIPKIFSGRNSSLIRLSVSPAPYILILFLGKEIQGK